MTEEEKNNINSVDDKSTKIEDKMDWRPVIFFYVKSTSWIVFPLLIGVLTGKYVSQSFGSQTLFFLSIMVGFSITCYGIYREIKQYKNQLDKDNLKK